MWGLQNIDTFIYDQIKGTNSHLFTCNNSLKIENGQYIINETNLKSLIKVRIRSH